MKKEYCLFSPLQDFAFIAGAPIFGYITLLSLMFGPAQSLVFFSMLLLLVLEGPHVFATATRAYFTPEDRNSVGRKKLWMLLPLCLIGPVFVAAGLLPVFYAITVVWLHTHVAKQHVGFLALYKRKAGEMEDIRYETLFFKTSLYLPVILFLTKDAAHPNSFLYAGMLYAVPFAYYVSRELSKKHLSTPKLMLVLTSVPLQWLAWGYAANHPLGARLAGIILAVSHTIQYHRLVIEYHRVDANDIEEMEKELNITRRNSRKKPWHSLAGYALMIIGANFVLHVLPRGIMSGNEVLMASLWGLSFQHYLLDAVIWKTKDYPVFRRAIGV